MMFALAGNAEGAKKIFAQLMSRLAAKREEVEGFLGGFEPLSGPGWRIGEYSRSRRMQLVYLLMFLAARAFNLKEEFSAAGGLERARQELRTSSSSSTGILGLPVLAYLNLATALGEASDSSVRGALLPFLTAYDSAIQRASLNAYHWNRMIFPFHPVEPDILSVLVLAESAIHKREMSIFKMLEVFPLSRVSGMILRDALNQCLSRD